MEIIKKHYKTKTFWVMISSWVIIGLIGIFTITLYLNPDPFYTPRIIYSETTNVINKPFDGSFVVFLVALVSLVSLWLITTTGILLFSEMHKEVKRRQKT